MEANNRSGSILIFALAGIALVVAFLGDIALGSVSIPISRIPEYLFSQESTPEATIIQEIRLPRALAALLAGAGLSLSGLQMQTLFRNPLAGPSVLGINSGASLGVALVVLTSASLQNILSIQTPDPMSNWSVIVASSLGSATILGLILLISFKLRDHITLLIVGIMVGNLTFSLVSIWQYFSAPDKVKEFLVWSFGDLGGVTPGHLPMLTTAIVLGTVISIFLKKDWDQYLLGETYARSMGSNIKRTRIGTIISTSLLTGSITAFCGPIGFLGIAVPHLTRSILGTSKHTGTMTGCLILGPFLMLICDIVAQLPGYGATLPISAVTSLIGAPVVIWVILRKRNIGKSFS